MCHILFQTLALMKCNCWSVNWAVEITNCDHATIYKYHSYQVCIEHAGWWAIGASKKADRQPIISSHDCLFTTHITAWLSMSWAVSTEQPSTINKLSLAITKLSDYHPPHHCTVPCSSFTHVDVLWLHMGPVGLCLSLYGKCGTTLGITPA